MTFINSMKPGKIINANKTKSAGAKKSKPLLLPVLAFLLIKNKTAISPTDEITENELKIPSKNLEFESIIPVFKIRAEAIANNTKAPLQRAVRL